jgi:pimeloyl-ACP methyl ester carboxylesterase
VASSIGCWLADQYAVREPRRVTGAVLIDPVNLTPWPITAQQGPSGGNDGETGYLQRIDTESFVELARTVPTDPRRTVVISSSQGRWQRQPPASITQWEPGALAALDELWQGYQGEWVRRTNARHVSLST